MTNPPHDSYRTVRRALLAALAAVCIATGALAADAPQPPDLNVADFLPEGYLRDGTVSYQPQLQAALDAAAGSGRNVTFPPMSYLLDDPRGLHVHSGQTLRMHGAKFVLSPDLRADGQAFRGEGVRDVSFLGGEIIGRNDVWPSGTNVRGIYLTGECRNIRVADMTIRDLSSNGVGVFGTDADHPAADVWLIDTVIDNCCNVYGDYQAPPPERRGPEAGSVREDQGSVAFYFVDDWVVRGCRFEDSRSDGTHFYRCRHGQFTDNRVYRARMGGYFVETCEHILAANNVIRDNGSRGVTIERGSRACTLIGNTVEGSGREGLWMPDCSRCVAASNLFLRNGRKDNGTQPQNVWDANITINESRGDPSNSPAEHCVVAHNLIDTGDDQVAAIRVVTEATVRGIVLEGNVFIGENRRIAVEGDLRDRVTITGNIGADDQP
jgi:parallel beta-helix repeat protein